MNKRSRNKWIYILANFFKGYYINIIGMISVTELFILGRIFYAVKFIRKIKSPEFKKISILFLILLLVQVMAEIGVGNSFINALKGIMITVMSYLGFVFYLELLLRDIRIVKWAPLALGASLIVFGDQFGYAETGQDTYFKFYFAPLIINLLLFVILNSRRLNVKAIVLATGGVALFVIAGGARSLGFSLLFALCVYYVYYRYKFFSWGKILPTAFLLVFSFQLFYAYLYVPKVATGEWGSVQNREQLARVGNSGNMLMMIFAARTDFFVSWQAFMDKPLFGHGSWAEDHNLHYFQLLKKFSNEDLKKGELGEDHLVPVHSVVIGMGTQHGILKFVVFCILFLYIYKLGIRALDKRIPNATQVNFYLIYLWISSFQHLLFGPPAVLKSTGSITFATFLAFYLFKKHFNEKKIQASRRNSNIQVN